MANAVNMGGKMQALVRSGVSLRPKRADGVVVNAEKGKETAVTIRDTKPEIVKQGIAARNKTGVYMASEQSLSYLDGTLPGDYGFDPLGVYDPEGQGGVITQEWLRYAEVIHARFAMLGAAGCIAPEILGKAGVIPEATGLIWWKAGFIGPASAGFDYWTDPYTLFIGQVVLMQFAELRRLQDFKKPGSMSKQYFLGLEEGFKGSGDPCYPGGPIFNFLNYGSVEGVGKGGATSGLDDLKLKEIKNGRLAMLSMFGYGAQAIMTGKGPIENLLDHLADPVHNNILTNFGNIFGQ